MRCNLAAPPIRRRFIIGTLIGIIGTVHSIIGTVNSIIGTVNGITGTLSVRRPCVCVARGRVPHVMCFLLFLKAGLGAAPQYNTLQRITPPQYNTLQRITPR
jgi:hypothetical protein